MKITPHRRTLNRERVQEIVRTARQHGLLGDGLGAAVAYRPSVGWVLLGGEHRWAALSAPGAKTKVIILRNWDDLVAWMAIDKSDTRSTPWNPINAVWFYDKVISVLKPGRGDRATEDICEFTGVHRQIIETVRWANGIINDPDTDPVDRKFLVDRLHAIERGDPGNTGHTVRDQYRRHLAKRANEGRAPQSAAVQRKALESIAVLEGTIAALVDMGPINPELTAEEREGHAARLGALGAKLAQIKKNLRGVK